MVLGYVDSGAVVRQNIMVAGTCYRGYSPHGGQEADRERGRNWELAITFQSMSAVTYYLKLGPTS
jgi:hypothetical protein